jgi:hypothetical protein
VAAQPVPHVTLSGRDACRSIQEPIWQGTSALHGLVQRRLSIFPGAVLGLISIERETWRHRRQPTSLPRDEKLNMVKLDLELLLTTPPKLHGEEGATTDAWRLDDAGILFLDSQVHGKMRTIETGAGVSTIVFALKRTRHTCIVPDERVVRRIRQYCRAAGLSLGTVDFVLERSEYALPLLHTADYDFALIDGRHGFPAPFIDWFYIADRLRPGGVVLLDDTWIWTCHVLASCLDVMPGWRRCAELPASAAFLKEYDGAQHADWVHQPFVYERSPAARFYPSSAFTRGHSAPAPIHAQPHSGDNIEMIGHVGKRTRQSRRRFAYPTPDHPAE